MSSTLKPLFRAVEREIIKQEKEKSRRVKKKHILIVTITKIYGEVELKWTHTHGLYIKTLCHVCTQKLPLLVLNIILMIKIKKFVLGNFYINFF